MKRFEALDGLRGAGACLIVAAHSSFFIKSSLHGRDLVEGLHILVDFFFVLSGFVIAAAFERRLARGDGLIPFAITRLGRLYPVHIATLSALVALKLALMAAGLDADGVMQMDHANEFDAASLLTNLFLVQALGVEFHLTWNFPAWSISTELYTYAAFAILWATLGVFKGGETLLFAVYVVLIVACALILLRFAPHGLRSTHDYAFVRCVLGFSAGVLAYRAYLKLGEAPFPWLSGAVATLAELGAVGACVLIVGQASGAGLTVLAPILLAGIVVLLAYGRGAVSRLLALRPLAALGALSYSIYLVHFVALIYEASILRLLGLSAPGSTASLWSGSAAVGDLIILGNVALAIGLAAVVHVFVEKPGRSIAARLAKTWEARHREFTSRASVPNAALSAAVASAAAHEAASLQAQSKPQPT